MLHNEQFEVLRLGSTHYRKWGF